MTYHILLMKCNIVVCIVIESRRRHIDGSVAVWVGCVVERKCN